MYTPLAFVERTVTPGAEPGWGRITDPPGVVSYGEEDFAEISGEEGQVGYVNGFKIVGGLQLLAAGDLVRMIGPDAPLPFLYAGRSSTGTEPGMGRRCAFTGLPITGAAVQCPNSQCRRMVSEQVAEQIGTCVCNTPLKREDISPPGEELL